MNYNFNRQSLNYHILEVVTEEPKTAKQITEDLKENGWEGRVSTHKIALKIVSNLQHIVQVTRKRPQNLYQIRTQAEAI